MSYARFSDNSDVYVFLHCNGWLECCGCLLEPSHIFQAFKTGDMLQHLRAHQKAGHKVPMNCHYRLRREASHNNAWIKRRIKQNGGVK